MGKIHFCSEVLVFKESEYTILKKLIFREVIYMLKEFLHTYEQEKKSFLVHEVLLRNGAGWGRI